MPFVLALLSPMAHAHASALFEGLDVVDHALGGQAVEASFGLLWQDSDAGAWQWLCHEAVTRDGAIIAPRYAFSASGAVLSAVPSLEQTREPGIPVYRTEDLCSWDPVDGLDDVPVIDVSTDPSDPALAIAIASDTAGGSGGSIHRSIDGGQGFTSVVTSGARFYRSVVHSPGGEAWVAASWYSPPGAWALHSTDGGQTWTEVVLPVQDVDADVDADVLLADETGAWFAVGPFRNDRLLHVAPDGTTTVVAEPGVELTDLARSGDGTLWLAGNADTYLQLDPSGLLTPLESAPTGQGIQVSGDILRLATRSRLDGTQIAESTDRGNSFTRTFHLSELTAPPNCPAATHVAVRCEPLWPELEARLPFPPDEDSPDDSGTSGPDGTDTAEPQTDGAKESAGRCGGGSAVALLLPLGLLARRRR